MGRTCSSTAIRAGNAFEYSCDGSERDEYLELEIAIAIVCCGTPFVCGGQASFPSGRLSVRL